MSSPAIKYWYFPGACSLAAHIILEDSGLPFEPILANIREPSVRSEYVRDVNTKGQVPVISVNGEHITEAPAILTAISQLAPNKHYTGSTPIETVRFYEWLNYLSGTVHGKYFGGLFRPGNYSTDAADEDRIRAKAKENVLAAFGQIEDKLKAQGGPKHAVGSSLTGVDGYLVVFHNWAGKFGLDLSSFPNYNKLVEGIKETAAFKAAAAKETPK